MNSAMRHRGPDGSGLFEKDNVTLGHLRLSIIDIEGGAQPFRLDGDKLVISYNGETYNFAELRNELTACGTSFGSRSDTEVVLRAYARWGNGFDDRLNGMYAYAIFDGQSENATLQLGVDPVGIKPLFLFQNDDWIIFASELRAVVVAMKALEIEVAVDIVSAQAYLGYGFVPAPRSMVRGVRAFGPGERCRIDARSGQISWLPRRTRPRAELDEMRHDALDERLRDILQRSIERQVVSDVPLGFFLSGGIDSSLLLTMAAKMGIATQSFTVRFKGKGHGVDEVNEADVAAEVARFCSSRHHEIAIDADMLLHGIDDCFAAMDQPLVDPACLPLLALSKFAREHVTVCLSGDGGDEIFAGYPRHRLEMWKELWQKIPSSARQAARHFAGWLPEAPSTGLAESLRKTKVGFSLLDDPRYVRGPFAHYGDGEAHSWNNPERGCGQSVMDADIDGQLAGQMLPKTDNMSMAASLECRVPLLDLELVGFAAAVPLSYKMNRSTGKLPLRRLLSEHLPPAITDRPKRGFRVPLTSWLRGEMANRVREELLGDLSLLQHIIPASEIHHVVDQHLNGQNEHSARIWALLALGAWSKRTLS